MKRGILVRLFDLHCDTLGVATDCGYSLTANTAAVDIRRGSRYRRWTQAFAAWLPDGKAVEESRQRCEQLLDTADRFAAETPAFHRVCTATDLLTTPPACRGVLTVENGGATAADAAYLQHLHARGVRLITLTWNGDNPWGCGCFGSADGLSPAGLRAMGEMERLGLTVDVSHLNEVGFWQVAGMATKPFVATHSNSAALHPHPRNLTDDQFRAIRDAGGVVGLNLYGDHLGGWDFSVLQRHLEHFLSLGGEHTVCIGADLDGMEIPPVWDGISVMEKLWQHLAGEGYPQHLLDEVFYNNAFAFFVKTLPKE